MLRFRLQNKASKPKSDLDIAAYNKQRNYVVALNQKSKYNYFNNLDASTGVNPFLKTCKLANYIFLTSVVGGAGILIDKNELILNNRKITTALHDYFAEIVPSLNLSKWLGNFKSLANNLDTVDSIVLKFHNYPSIKMIKTKFRNIAKFSFQQLKLADVKKRYKVKSLKGIRLINPQVEISQLIFQNNVICVFKS